MARMIAFDPIIIDRLVRSSVTLAVKIFDLLPLTSKFFILICQTHRVLQVPVHDVRVPTWAHVPLDEITLCFFALLSILFVLFFLLIFRLNLDLNFVLNTGFSLNNLNRLLGSLGGVICRQR